MRDLCRGDEKDVVLRNRSYPRLIRIYNNIILVTEGFAHEFILSFYSLYPGALFTLTEKERPPTAVADAMVAPDKLTRFKQQLSSHNILKPNDYRNLHSSENFHRC